MKIEMKKFSGNPILMINPTKEWESKAVFNAGVYYEGGLFHMLYRAIGEYDEYISRLGYATSSDGENFQRMSNDPVFIPEKDFERWGCEDPRIMKVEGEIFVTYVVLSRSAKAGAGLIRTALARTKDFRSFERLGMITPDIAIDKDTFLFPRKINGRYAMLHRPRNWIRKDIRQEKGKTFVMVDGVEVKWNLPELPKMFPEKPSIWLAYSDDMIHWGNHQVIMEPKFDWDNCKIGGGCPPIETKTGWLSINHGVEKIGKKHIYRGSVALLDLDDPSRVLWRPKEPFLAPEFDYEIEGDVPHVVFPEGAAFVGDELFVYYGGGDKCVNLARGRIR